MDSNFRKEKYCQVYQYFSYLEELIQIEGSIIKKPKNEGAYETKIEDQEHHFNYCVELDTNTESRFVRISFNRLSKFKRILAVCLYYNITKKVIKGYVLVIFFLWLETKQIEKLLITISNFELSVETTI